MGVGMKSICVGHALYYTSMVRSIFMLVGLLFYLIIHVDDAVCTFLTVSFPESAPGL